MYFPCTAVPRLDRANDVVGHGRLVEHRRRGARRERLARRAGNEQADAGYPSVGWIASRTRSRRAGSRPDARRRRSGSSPTESRNDRENRDGIAATSERRPSSTGGHVRTTIDAAASSSSSPPPPPPSSSRYRRARRSHADDANIAGHARAAASSTSHAAVVAAASAGGRNPRPRPRVPTFRPRVSRVPTFRPESPSRSPISRS